MYINGSGRDYYEFYIQLNRCGTLGKNAISEKSRENPTVFYSIQFKSIRILKINFIKLILKLSFRLHFRILCGTQLQCNIIH